MESLKNVLKSSWDSSKWKRVKMVVAFVWPKKNLEIQLRIIGCFILLAAERVINVLVPVYNQKIVDNIESKVFCWDLILIYCTFKFLQGAAGKMGLLKNLREIAWAHVEQHTEREIEIGLFSHLHSLSLRWHLDRKTGEVLGIMDRGTWSVNSLINYTFFLIGPMIIDVVVSICFLSITFNWYIGLIVFIMMALYTWTTIAVTIWGKKFQVEMVTAHDDKNSRSTDSLLNSETVKYYGAEEYEVDAYRKAMLKHQQNRRQSSRVWDILNTIQNAAISVSLLAGSLLCAHLAVDGNLTSGQYVLFASYVVQLYAPLSWFGSLYLGIQRSFVNMQKMFDIFEIEQEVKDSPDAIELPEVKGKITVSNVSFGYTPERTILKNVSFEVQPGKTTAIVGPTGSGKSTVMRLLFRFYDVNEGSICVDGHDVKSLKQKSLRQAIGVVPQDTVLFNDTIMYNIRYGRLTASDEEVYSAAKAADIHDKIMNFPEKYDTKVGERGLRLSGGEKQRVAIARTILKAPSIVLLDEATSALDTQTERNIQVALSKVCMNRTTIIVAHRLSTIIHSDEILVLKDGEIIERGRHETLLDKNGIYADMWNQQLQNNYSDSNSDTTEDDSHEKQD